MPANLLILPLLAGYLFTTRVSYLRYKGQLGDGYRLLLDSSVWGLVMLVVARALTFSAHYFSWLDSPKAMWYEIPPWPFIGTASLSTVLGYFSPWLINRFWMDAETSKDTAIENSGDPLAILLNDAIARNSPVEISLQSRKFYIGYVTSFPLPDSKNKHLALLPLLSGYRDPQSLRFNFTTNYSPARQLKDFDANDLKVVIPVDTILSARFFDASVYTRTFSSNKPESSTTLIDQ